MTSNKEQIKKQAIKCLDNINFSPCTKKTRELYVVLINGKRVSLNGKNAWRGIGAARSVLNGYLKSFLRKAISLEILPEAYRTREEAITEAVEEWASKHVVLVPFSKYVIAEQKRQEASK